MTLPKLNWRQGAVYTGSSAGIANHIASIYNLINAEALVGGTWVVNYYSASPAQVELKLASPANATLAKIRVLIFGGTLPNANACESGITPNTTTIYVYIALDGDTDGTYLSTHSYASGDPYSSATLKAKGSIWIASADSQASTSMYMYDCEEGFIIRIVGSNTGVMSLTFGRFIDDASADGRWVRFLPNSTLSNGEVSSPTANSSVWTISGIVESGSYGSGVAIYETGIIYSIGRVSNDLSNHITLTDPSLGGIFMTVPLARKIRNVGSVWTYGGVLRQMRYGPSLPDRTKIYSEGILSGFALANLTVNSVPLYLDQNL